MSPEPMEMGTPDIDTRTGIYTQGVLFYELLVGKLSFKFAWPGKVTCSGIQHRIRNDVPMKPGQRVSSPGAEQAGPFLMGAQPFGMRHDDWMRDGCLLTAPPG